MTVDLRRHHFCAVDDGHAGELENELAVLLGDQHQLLRQVRQRHVLTALRLIGEIVHAYVPSVKVVLTERSVDGNRMEVRGGVDHDGLKVEFNAALTERLDQAMLALDTKMPELWERQGWGATPRWTRFNVSDLLSIRPL